MRTFHQTGGRIAQRGRQSGLTVIELVVVLAIAAVLAVTGIPSFLTTINNYRIMSEANALAGDLRYARAVAIQQGANAQLCMSTNASSCSSSATTFKTGYIVLDSNGNLVRNQNAFSGTDTMTSSTSSGSAPTAIFFNRDGFAGTSSGSNWDTFSMLSGNLHVKIQAAGASSSQGICVVVSKVGQISQVAAGASDAFGNAC